MVIGDNLLSYVIGIMIVCKSVFAEDNAILKYSTKLWATGGLAKKSFQRETFLVETKDVKSYRAATGPVLPEPRIMHCMVSINSSHSFLHGGFKPIDPNIKFKNNYDFILNYWGFRIWNYKSSPNETALGSSLYDWDKNVWTVVCLIYLEVNC